MSAAPIPSPRLQNAGQYRVLVVDDSAVIRTILSAWLRFDRDIEVAGVAVDGHTAVEAASRLQPEIVLLDIEMPGMSGLDALPGILKAAPAAKVVMCSTLTQVGAEVTLKALQAGAADYVAKPQSAQLGSAENFRRELIAKVRALGEAARRKTGLPQPFSQPRYADRQAGAAGGAGPRYPLRAPGKSPVRVVLIGSSTGGPPALIRIFSEWTTAPRVPILITQHMPPAFTAILAKRLDSAGAVRCREAVDGDLVTSGTAYVAPGDFHMTVVSESAGPVLRLNQAAPENYCRPSVDPMFRSAVAVYKSGCFASILTGMGHDGLAGARAVIDAGGTVIAQDQESSVVWGMPGAVTNAGLCSRVLPLSEMSCALQKSISGELK